MLFLESYNLGSNLFPSLRRPCIIFVQHCNADQPLSILEAFTCRRDFNQVPKLPASSPPQVIEFLSDGISAVCNQRLEGDFSMQKFMLQQTLLRSDILSESVRYFVCLSLVFDRMRNKLLRVLSTSFQRMQRQDFALMFSLKSHEGSSHD